MNDADAQGDVANAVNSLNAAILDLENGDVESAAMTIRKVRDNLALYFDIDVENP